MANIWRSVATQQLSVASLGQRTLHQCASTRASSSRTINSYSQPPQRQKNLWYESELTSESAKDMILDSGGLLNIGKSRVEPTLEVLDELNPLSSMKNAEDRAINADDIITWRKGLENLHKSFSRNQLQHLVGIAETPKELIQAYKGPSVTRNPIKKDVLAKILAVHRFGLKDPSGPAIKAKQAGRSITSQIVDISQDLMFLLAGSLASDCRQILRQWSVQLNIVGNSKRGDGVQIELSGSTAKISAVRQWIEKLQKSIYTDFDRLSAFTSSSTLIEPRNDDEIATISRISKSDIIIGQGEDPEVAIVSMNESWYRIARMLLTADQYSKEILKLQSYMAFSLPPSPIAYASPARRYAMQSHFGSSLSNSSNSCRIGRQSLPNHDVIDWTSSSSNTKDNAESNGNINAPLLQLIGSNSSNAESPFQDLVKSLPNGAESQSRIQFFATLGHFVFPLPLANESDGQNPFSGEWALSRALDWIKSDIISAQQQKNHISPLTPNFETCLPPGVGNLESQAFSSAPTISGTFDEEDALLEGLQRSINSEDRTKSRLANILSTDCQFNEKLRLRYANGSKVVEIKLQFIQQKSKQVEKQMMSFDDEDLDDEDFDDDELDDDVENVHNTSNTFNSPSNSLSHWEVSDISKQDFVTAGIFIPDSPIDVQLSVQQDEILSNVEQLSEETWKQFIKDINHLRPEQLAGFPKYSNENAFAPSPPLKIVIDGVPFSLMTQEIINTWEWQVLEDEQFNQDPAKILYTISRNINTGISQSSFAFNWSRESHSAPSWKSIQHHLAMTVAKSYNAGNAYLS